MDHVVTLPAEPAAVADGALWLHQVPAAHDNLVWLLVDPSRGEAAAVDGPGDAEVLAAVERLGVRLTTILTTHTHGDHVGLHHALARHGGLDGMRVVGHPARQAEIPGLSDPKVDGDTLDLFGRRVRVWGLDGHQRHHLAYVLDGVVLCGDVMFAGGCGRIFEGTPAELFASLLRLAELPPATRVACAHEYTEDNLAFAAWIEPCNAALGARQEQVASLRAAGRSAVPSTVEEERATNPYLRVGSPELLARVREEVPDVGDGPLAVFTALRALKDRAAHRAPRAPRPG